MLDVRFKNGRTLGKVEESFAATLSHRRHLLLRRPEPRGRADRHSSDLIVRATSQARAHPHLWRRADAAVDQPRRPRPRLPRRRRANGRASPTMCANGWNAAAALGASPPRPAAGRDLPARRPPLHGRLQLRGLERAPVARHADHPADGDAGPEAARLRRQRLCARGCYGSKPVTDPAALFSPDILEHEFVDWVQQSHLLKRAFREVAVIGGLVERQHPGQAQDRASRSPSRPT